MEKARKPGSSDGGQLASAAVLCASLSTDILDQIQDAVFTTDLRGVITGCNQAVSRYEYAPEELIGRNLADLLGRDGESLARVVIPTVLKNGRYDDMPIDCVTGSKKLVNVHDQYNTERLHPLYKSFHMKPLFIMTSDLG